MEQPWTAVISQDEGWWIGWIAEVPGVNAQERTREDLLESLVCALREALEMNRRDAMEQASDYEQVAVAL
ncbi:MAG: type II toxin-antitoxin system HicB family antitoxin [Gammaproteobacteria bacterium]|nr:type II toxin-antitoxin system HicB family antitoxin [Gammaproteobacteria bacterium]MDE0366034.1 type II toxin-antitoxin system HicB family antitoxin [Gammaproteobacteria bacterium]